MRGRRDLLFALVGGGGDPHLAPRREARELGELAPVGRQRRRVELDIAGDQDVWGAKRRETVAVGFAAREAYVELRQQRGDEARRPPQRRNERSLIRPLIIAGRDLERFSSTTYWARARSPPPARRQGASV